MADERSLAEEKTPVSLSTGALAVMARLPERGRVKTRLAADIGAEAACLVYCRLLLDTLRRLASLEGVSPIVALAADDTTDPMDPPPTGTHVLSTALQMCGADPAGVLDDGAWSLVRQRGEGLGPRLANTFSDLLAAGHPAAVLVNGDSPALPTEYLRRALRMLHDAVAAGHKDEVVLGPATDGGFYLIGVHRDTWTAAGDVAAEVLASVPMGTPATAAAIVASLTARGFHVRQLPLWLDVDEAADLPACERLLESEDAGRDEAADAWRGEASTGASRWVPSGAARRGAARRGASGRDLRGAPLVGLREIYLHVTNRCGLGCPHCYNQTNPRDPGEMTTAEWRAAIDQCVDLGASSFVFLGGDPLLRDDLFDLIEHVTGTRGRPARIFFNGECGEETAQRFAAAGHGLLRPLLSVDGDEDVNDELRGSGNYAATLDALRNLTAAGLAPVMNTVTLAPVLPTLPAMARAIKQAGATRLHLILPHQRGGLPAHLELLPSGQAMLSAVKKLAATCERIGLMLDNMPSWRRRLTGRQDFCTAGCRDLAIDPAGGVYACTITCGDPAFAAGELRHERLDHIWRHSPALRLLRAGRARDRAQCAACPVVDACGGDCWMQAHYAARIRHEPAGLLAPFPYCDLVRPLFEEMMTEAAEAAACGAGAGGAASRGGKEPADAASAACSTPTGEPCGVATAGGEADYTLFDCI